MDQNISVALRLSRRIAGYFTGALTSESRLQDRMLSGVKALFAAGAIGIGLFVIYAVLLIPFTPSIGDLRKSKADQPSVLMSADGQRLAVFNRTNRAWVSLDQVSPNVLNALIATEDHRFYDHHGIDIKRTVASAARSLIGKTEGGSTLTQQLARNLYPEEIGRNRSVNRKLKEMITAFKIEHAYTKKEILETYLNTVPFLYNAFGIEMAARTYFDTSADKLTVLESATLIGMLKGNSYYNPVLNPERAVNRRNVVLSQMRKHATLSEAHFNTLIKRPIRLDFARQEVPVGPAPHFSEHVRKWLVEWAAENDYNIYLDGLVVTTGIDSRLQAAANEAVTRQMNALQAVADVEWSVRSERQLSSSTAAYVAMRRQVQPFRFFWESKRTVVDAFIRESGAYRSARDAGSTAEAALTQLRQDRPFITALQADKTRLQSGFVAMDPRTGQIKAWVGSRDFDTDQYDHVARAQRQPGSTFKAFVYGAALEQGMSPKQQFIDRAVEIPIGHGEIWRPTDLGAPSGRPTTIRDALIHSKNTITAQVMQEVGPKKTAALARKMGIRDSTLDPVMALALGTSPVTTLEMVTAYSTIASGGDYHRPVLVTQITDKSGKILAQFGTKKERALSAEAAGDLLDMLRGVINQGTGQAVRSRFGIRADVAGKTGTTQNNTDGWFMLMHPQLVAGSWVGFNDARVTMRSNYWGQGGHNALLVVSDFFRHALDARLIDPARRFDDADAAGARSTPSTLDRFLTWLGWKKAPLAAPPAPASQRPPARPPVPKASEDERNQVIEQMRQDELNRIIEQTRREEPADERPAPRLREAPTDSPFNSGPP